MFGCRDRSTLHGAAHLLVSGHTETAVKVLRGIVAGSCVAKPKHVVCMSRRARQQKADDRHNTHSHQHYDFSMDEPGFGLSVARLAMTIDEGTATADA